MSAQPLVGQVYLAPTGADSLADGWENIGFTSLDGFTADLEITIQDVDPKLIALATGASEDAVIKWKDPEPITKAALDDYITDICRPIPPPLWAIPEEPEYGYTVDFNRDYLTGHARHFTLNTTISSKETTMNPLTDKKTKRVLDRRTTAGRLGAHDIGNLVQVTTVNGVEIKSTLDALQASGSLLSVRFTGILGQYYLDPDSKVTVWILETPEEV